MTNPTTSAAAPRAVRRYLGRLAAFLCALALPFALLIGFIGFVPETSQQSLLYTLHYKLDLLRDTRGQDIDGACGQLAAKEQPGGETGSRG